MVNLDKEKTCKWCGQTKGVLVYKSFKGEELKYFCLVCRRITFSSKEEQTEQTGKNEKNSISCPKCGQPMVYFPILNPTGESGWQCPNCRQKIYELFSEDPFKI